MTIRLTILKGVWRAAEAMRAWLRPLIEGTVLYKILQVPSKFIRHRMDWRKESKDSIFCREEEMAMCSLLPSRVLDVMINRFKPKTVLDVGCGTGQAIEYLLGHGIDAVGIEGSELAISKAASPQRIIQANLNKPVSLNQRFDVVFSYEVLEHIHPKFLNALMSTLTAHSDVVIISHAQPGQGGEGHFNEQPDDYWIEQFGRVKYEVDWSATKEFKSCGEMYAGNMLAFRRAVPKEVALENAVSREVISPSISGRA